MMISRTHKLLSFMMVNKSVTYGVNMLIHHFTHRPISGLARSAVCEFQPVERCKLLGTTNWNPESMIAKSMPLDVFSIF